MAGAKFGKGWSDDGQGLIWLPLGAVDPQRTSKWAGPGSYGNVVEEVANGSYWTHGIVATLALPAADAGVEQRIGEYKEELYVFVEVVIVALRYVLCEEAPVAGRLCGVGTVAPVFGDDLFAIRQSGTDLEEVAGQLREIWLVGEKWLANAVHNLVLAHAEGDGVLPVGRGKVLSEKMTLSIWDEERLPSARIA